MGHRPRAGPPRRGTGSEEEAAPVDPFQLAVRLLGIRPHFEAQLRAKLARRGCAADAVAATLDRLRQLGYLNDPELARQEARRLRTTKRLALGGVARELGRAGADEAAIAAAIEALDDGGEVDAARAAAEHWLRTHRPEADRLARHLDRKGYPRHVIFSVLKDLIAHAAHAAHAADIADDPEPG